MNFKLVYKSNFNLYLAELDEWYELWQLKKNWRGKEVWKPVYMHFGEWSTIPHRGDIKWAKRIAKRFGIEVPKPKEQLKGVK